METKTRLSTVTQVTILMALYFIGGFLGLHSSFNDHGAEIILIWPPAGIAVAAFLVLGYRFWPGVFLGAMILSLITYPSWIFALMSGVGSVAGALICCYLLERLTSFDRKLNRSEDIVALISFSALGAVVIAAFNAVSLEWNGGSSDVEAFGAIWFRWWVQNTMGLWILTPLLLSFALDHYKTPLRIGRILEFGACMALLLLGTVISFNSWYFYGLKSYPLAYLPYPFLVWAALRFEQKGASLGVIVVSALAIYGLLEGKGPFQSDLLVESLMLLGAYLGFLSVSVHLVASTAAHRRLASEALESSEWQLRSTLESIKEGIITLKPDALIESINQGGNRIFSFRDGELINRKFEILLSETSREEFRSHWEHMFEAVSNENAGAENMDRNGLDLELKGVRRDGDSFPLEVSLNRVQFHTQPRVIAVIRDISFKKHLEEKLAHSQKMEAIGRLAGGIAHGFNNLLQVIFGYCNLALARVKDGIAYAECEQIEHISNAAARAAVMTNQLLTFSRKSVVKPRVIQLNQVIQNMEATLRRFLGEGITLEVSLKENLEKISADPNQMEQVILNLVSNACDAMPHGGLLTIKTCSASENPVVTVKDPAQLWIPAPKTRSWNHIALEIGDTGCGMSQDVMGHIFEPFFTTKDIGKGTGLGLSTVFGIVQEFDGEIQVDSSVGHGTRIKLSFPVEVHAAEELAPKKSFDDSILNGTENILLVDDEDMVRDMLFETLTMQGYKVQIAEHGKEALQLFKEQDGEFDLLVTDVVMPMMNGRELAEAILKIKPHQRILYLSGYSDSEMMRHGLLESRSSFLQKPFRSEAFLSKIREMLDLGEDLKDEGGSL